MKRKNAKWIPLILISTGALALTGCWTAPNASVQPKGQPGMIEAGIQVRAVEYPATVQAIDTTQGTITLALPDGTTTVYKIGPKVKNSKPIQAGDTVKAKVTDE